MSSRRRLACRFHRCRRSSPPGAPLAAHGRLSFAAVIGAAALACFIADTLWFALGRKFGSRGLTFVCRLSLSPYACVGRRARELMSHWGARLMLVAKFVPGAGQMTAPTSSVPLACPSRASCRSSSSAVSFGSACSLSRAPSFARASILRSSALRRRATGPHWWVSVVIVALIIQRIVRGRMLLAELGRQRVSVQTVHQRMQSPEPMMIFDVRTIDSRRADNRRIPGAKAHRSAGAAREELRAVSARHRGLRSIARAPTTRRLQALPAISVITDLPKSIRSPVVGTLGCTAGYPTEDLPDVA